MQHEIAADRIAAQGLLAGKGIWAAVEAAYEAGMNWNRARAAFDSLLQTLSEDVGFDEQELFRASAYEAIPHVHLNAVERSEIDSNAWDAWTAFSRGEAA